MFNTSPREIRCSVSGLEDLSLVAYYAIYTGKELPKFDRILLSTSSGSSSYLS
jgi:hypothetical protein